MGVNGVLVEILGNVEEVTVDPIPSQEQLLCGGNPAAIRLSFRVTNISEEVIRIWALALISAIGSSRVGKHTPNSRWVAKVRNLSSSGQE